MEKYGKIQKKTDFKIGIGRKGEDKDSFLPKNSQMAENKEAIGMNVTYVLTTDWHTVDGRSRIFYGIAALDGETILLAARSLGSDRGRVEALIDNCNRLGLSPLHFWDVVEDFLAD